MEERYYEDWIDQPQKPTPEAIVLQEECINCERWERIKAGCSKSCELFKALMQNGRK